MEYAESQTEEMEMAFRQSRQPKCVYCDRPLDSIIQTQYERISWQWDANLKKYLKQEPDGDSDPPYHPGCGNSDWGYVDEQLVSY